MEDQEITLEIKIRKARFEEFEKVREGLGTEFNFFYATSVGAGVEFISTKEREHEESVEGKPSAELLGNVEAILARKDREGEV